MQMPRGAYRDTCIKGEVGAKRDNIIFQTSKLMRLFMADLNISCTYVSTALCISKPGIIVDIADLSIPVYSCDKE